MNYDIFVIIRLVVARITSKAFQVEVNCINMSFQVFIILSFVFTVCARNLVLGFFVIPHAVLVVAAKRTIFAFVYLFSSVSSHMKV